MKMLRCHCAAIVFFHSRGTKKAKTKTKKPANITVLARLQAQIPEARYSANIAFLASTRQSNKKHGLTKSPSSDVLSTKTTASSKLFQPHPEPFSIDESTGHPPLTLSFPAGHVIADQV